MKSAQSKPTPTSRHRRHLNQRTATDSPARVSYRANRAGFTLVELLMVIVIIGILVSMLVVAVNPALRTAREFAVTQEMKQMDLAIENFRNQYGFYPPSFTGFNRVRNMEAQLLPFLNKLSPNHRELTTVAPGITRLQVWWNAIGRHLDDRGSLIFWLNGLSNNKQFPITGGLSNIDGGGNAVATGGNVQLPVIFNADLAILVDPTSTQNANDIQRGEADIIGGAFERESLFDFRGGQLSNQAFDQTTQQFIPTAAGVRVYNQPYGNARFDLAYRYRNAAFYDLPDPNPSNPSKPFPGRSLDAFYVNTDGDQVFLNPGTFQLSTLGLDGQVSGFASTAINQPSPTLGMSLTGERTRDAAEWKSLNADNIANFANGRLDGFDWSESVELGDKNPQ